MATERLEIDAAHSGIHFSVKHLVVAKVRGQFRTWSGTILIPEDDLAHATVSVTIDAASIDTGVAERDTHLKSADFLDVATWPHITFEADDVDVESSERLKVAGNLTLHGVTRPVMLDVEFAGRTRDPWGHERAGFSARTSINRSDFGLVWNQLIETGVVVVGERIDLEFEIEAVVQPAAAPAVEATPPLAATVA